MTSYLSEVETGNGTLACLSLFLYWGGGGGVQDPTFFGNAKFEVKIFSLYLLLWNLFPMWCWGRVRDPTFFGHAKFEVKNFSLYLALWTLFPQVVVGGDPGPNFFGHAKFEVKNFSLYLELTLDFKLNSRLTLKNFSNFFSSMPTPNLKKIFHFTPCVYLAYLRSYSHLNIVKYIGMYQKFTFKMARTLENVSINLRIG